MDIALCFYVHGIGHIYRRCLSIRWAASLCVVPVKKYIRQTIIETKPINLRPNSACLKIGYPELQGYLM